MENHDCPGLGGCIHRLASFSGDPVQVWWKENYGNSRPEAHLKLQLGVNLVLETGIPLFPSVNWVLIQGLHLSLPPPIPRWPLRNEASKSKVPRPPLVLESWFMTY